MEGLNLYAYIFLIIIVLVYSAIKKVKKNVADENKKAVRPQTTPNKHDEGMSEWEKWFAQSEENEEISKEQKAEVFLTSESKIHNSYVPISKSIPKPKKVNQPPTKQKTKINLNSREDARRAILYSEIINRKY